jgi:hypothetical protein
MAAAGKPHDGGAIRPEVCLPRGHAMAHRAVFFQRIFNLIFNVSPVLADVGISSLTHLLSHSLTHSLLIN